MGCPNCAAVWILISSIEQASVELFLRLFCEGIIECEVDNLGPLGNLQWGLRPGAVTSIRNCAFVRGAPGEDHVTIVKLLSILYLSAGQSPTIKLIKKNRVAKVRSFFIFTSRLTDKLTNFGLRTNTTIELKV